MLPPARARPAEMSKQEELEELTFYENERDWLEFGNVNEELGGAVRPEGATIGRHLMHRKRGIEFKRPKDGGVRSSKSLREESVGGNSPSETFWKMIEFGQIKRAGPLRDLGDLPYA